MEKSPQDMDCEFGPSYAPPMLPEYVRAVIFARLFANRADLEAAGYIAAQK